MKRTIEIEDNLQEIIESVKDDVTDVLRRWIEENPDDDSVPCLHNDLDYSGSIHEIIDSAVPVYTREIEGLFYLYSIQFETAFDNAGIGHKDDKGWPNGWKAAAIYCYISQEISEWYQDEADDLCEEIRKGESK